MTGPVDDDDIVAGCVKWLLGFADVTAVLGGFPNTSVPWLFQHRLWTTVEGSQSTAAVIVNAGGFAAPNLHNRMRFTRISLEISADPLRDAANNIIDPGEVNRRIVAAYRAFDVHLHRPQGGEQYWGQLRIVGSARLGEYVVYPIPEGGGALRLQVFYGVTEG